MAKIIRVSELARNDALDAIAARLDSGGGAGWLRLYSGVMPATPEAAIGVGNTLLASLPLSFPCAPPAVGGVLTFDSVSQANAVAAGTASFVRLTSSANVVVIDGNVGTTSLFFVTIDGVTIKLGIPVRVLSIVINL